MSIVFIGVVDINAHSQAYQQWADGHTGYRFVISKDLFLFVSLGPINDAKLTKLTICLSCIVLLIYRLTILMNYKLINLVEASTNS